MSYTARNPKEAYDAVISGRYPEIHSRSCRCSLCPVDNPSKNQLKARLQARLSSPARNLEKHLLEDRLHFMELQNGRLHEKLLHYQRTMEELEQTHMDLVGIVRKEHETQRTSRSRERERSGAKDLLIDAQFEGGEYLVSMKKLSSSHNRSTEESSPIRNHLDSNRKDFKVQLNRSGNPNQTFNLSPDRANPERSPLNKPFEREMQRATGRIKQLQEQLSEMINMRSKCRTVEGENQLLKMKLKNISETVNECEESTKYHQNEIVRLKKLIEEQKQRESGLQILERENHSLKNSMGSLRRQYEELEVELEGERELVKIVRREMGEERQRNYALGQELRAVREDTSQVDLLADQLSKQKRTIGTLNDELRLKSSSLETQKKKVQKFSNLAQQVLQIKRIIEGIDLVQMQHSERKTFLQEKTRNIHLTNQLESIGSQAERYRQQILLLEEKISHLNADKDIVTSNLHQAQQYNSILQTQINNLSGSIEKYLKEEPRETMSRYSREEEATGWSPGLGEVRRNISRIIDRLTQLEERLLSECER